MEPTPVFLPEESPWIEEPGGLQSIGLQTDTTQHTQQCSKTVKYQMSFSKNLLILLFYIGFILLITLDGKEMSTPSSRLIS